MNSVNRVRPAVQFQCVSLCPFVYVQIVREPGKPDNHKVVPASVVLQKWIEFYLPGYLARLAASNNNAIGGGSGGNRADSGV